MLPEASSYDEWLRRFEWKIPEFYNLGVDVCDKWAQRDPDRLALSFVEQEGGQRKDLTFSQLRQRSNQLANLLTSRGLEPGDRVGILLPQLPETAFSHIAIHKCGAISVPLFTLFGPDALLFRLKDAGVRFLITQSDSMASIEAIRAQLPDLQEVFLVDGDHPSATSLDSALGRQPASFEPVKTRAQDPALIIYTSGTTGQPKGALHAHRVLLGHLPGVEMSHNGFPRAGDKIWTPADWAWIGGLLDVLMPALHHGVPVVACRFGKFSSQKAIQLIRREGIRNVFLPPTALKMMRSDLGDQDPQVEMRSVASGGESLGSELLDWGRRVLGVTINEFYGQTECNMTVSSCSALMTAPEGFMGRAVPGHTLAIVDNAGKEVPRGTTGTIAVKAPDPVMFLEYWHNPRATREKYIGDWLLTGDTGYMNAEGWIRFVGRDDDVITSSGYRIGPGEIENCLIAHPAIRMAAAVGVPDPTRTQVVKAYVVLNEGLVGSESLKDEIQTWVKTRLAAHEYPREVEFVDNLPMTATGKIIRRELRRRPDR